MNELDRAKQYWNELDQEGFSEWETDWFVQELANFARQENARLASALEDCEKRLAEAEKVINDFIRTGFLTDATRYREKYPDAKAAIDSGVTK